MLDRLLRPLTDRWPWLAFALKVQRRFGEVRGNYLASAFTLVLFLAIFPLLIVAIAVLGYATYNDANTTEKIINNLGLTGQSAQTMTDALSHAASTKKAASVIGLVGLFWSGLGVVSALQYILDATWQRDGRGIKDKLRGVLWCIGALTIGFVSISLTTYTEVTTHGFVPTTVSIVAATFVNFIFWMWTFLILSYNRLSWRTYLPGAIVGAIGSEVVKQLATWLPQVFSNASALYGSIGVVFGLIAIIALFGRVAVYASVVNVIQWEEGHGTVTVNVELPRIPGEVPLHASRTGAELPT